MSNIDKDLILTVVTNSIRTIVPATTFATDPKIYMSAEDAAVKPALLYGDHVTLRSYLLDVGRMAAHYDRQYQMPLRRLFIPISFARNARNEVFIEYGIDPPSRQLRDDANRFFETWKSADTDRSFELIDEFWDEHELYLTKIGQALFESAHEFAGSIDLSRFQAARDQGILDVAGWSNDAPEFLETEQEYMDRAGDFIYDQLDDERARLVLDAGAADTLNSSTDNAEYNLTRGLLEPLPAFSRASVDEIIDIRSELKMPLSRFRAEVSELTESNESEAYTPEDVSDIWRRKVRPALDEIGELTMENRYLRRLADKSMDAKTLLPATATFALGFAGLSGITQICAASAGISSVPLEAARAKRDQKKEIRKKRFYFLWSLSNR